MTKTFILFLSISLNIQVDEIVLYSSTINMRNKNNIFA